MVASTHGCWYRGFFVLPLLWVGCVTQVTECWESSAEKGPATSTPLCAHTDGVVFPSGSLPYCLDVAFKNSPSLKRSWAQAKIAAAQKGQADAAFYPNVDTALTATKARGSAYAGGVVSTATTTTYVPSVELTYKLFQFGADKATADAAKAVLYAAQMQYDRDQQALVYNVQRAFYGLQQAHAVVESAEMSQKDADTTYVATQQKLAVGLTNAQDVLRARASFLQSCYDLENAKASVETARATLAQCLGVSVSASIDVDKMYLPPGETTVLDSDVEKLMKHVLAVRQDLTAARSTLTAKEQLARAQKLKMLPSLNMSLGESWIKYKGSNVGAQRNYTGALAAKWNAFNGFDSTYSLLEARAQKESAHYDVHAAELQASAEVWTAYHAFRSAVKQLDAARALEAATDESFKAMQSGYMAGLNSLLDVLNAQKDLADARKSKVLAESQLALVLAELAYVSGGVIENVS